MMKYNIVVGDRYELLHTHFKKEPENFGFWIFEKNDTLPYFALSGLLLLGA